MIVPTVILLLSLRWGRTAFAEDYPPDIRESMPEFTSADRIRGWIFGPSFVLCLLASVAWTAWSWIDAASGRNYFDAYLMALATFVLFALIDLFVVDWLVICWWRPRWVVIPGTESAAGWGDYRFHVRAQLSPKGIAATFLLPAALAGIAEAASRM